MKKASEDILKVFFLICDMRKSMDLCRCGLEAMGNEEAISMIGIYKELLSVAEDKLRNIIEYIDGEVSETDD